MRGVEKGVAGLLLMVLALGLALLPLLIPTFARAQVVRYSEVAPTEALPIAEAARSFVVWGDDDSRSQLSSVMPPNAVSHLDDVRRVIGGARIVTVVLAVVLAAWAAIRVRQSRGDVVAGGLRAGGVATLAFVALVAIVGVTNFDAFFSAFHGLFFEPGTWVFPYDSLLIQLFPEPFWTTAGIWWGVLTALIGVVYAVLARTVPLPTPAERD